MEVKETTPRPPVYVNLTGAERGLIEKGKSIGGIGPKHFYGYAVEAYSPEGHLQGALIFVPLAMKESFEGLTR